MLRTMLVLTTAMGYQGCSVHVLTATLLWVIADALRRVEGALWFFIYPLATILLPFLVRLAVVTHVLLDTLLFLADRATWAADTL